MSKRVLAIVVIFACVATVQAQSSFVNWESPPVHPLELTPDGTHLIVANTPDNRVEIFEVTAGGLTHLGAVPVGLDPVSVRAASNSIVWVNNLISDTISIVDLTAMNVVQTLSTGDEPADVVFAGDPLRAFVTISQLNQVWVYDPADLTAAPVVLDIAGEDPRALATDGTDVYAAIFESGNGTTILSQPVVSSSVNPYPGDANPPPNDGTAFDPPMAAGLPVPPEVGLIVRKGDSGTWLDDNGADWSAAVTWDLHDHDVAVINADSLAISYVSGLMNADMAIAVSPGGAVTVVGIDTINDIRFEPNVQGVFVQVIAASFDPSGGTPAIIDLNPHLDYSVATVSQDVRDEAIGDPRGIAWNAFGDRGYVIGMGSNNVAVYDSGFNRLGLIEVGDGPAGIVVDDTHDRLYVLNRFEGSVSLVDTAADAWIELERVDFYDPTPDSIRDGRPFLYDTHETSGLGQSSCASCHIDARTDQVAWDLGDPAGAVKEFNQNCNGGLLPGCEDWHPMKGPMTTQTLFGITGTEPLHWRGDREELSAFNPAFKSLLGDDEQLTAEEMELFAAFIESLTPPPNPFRNFDGSLPTSFPNGGNPQIGANLFNNVALDGIFACATCHTLPTGTNGVIISGNLLQETQSVKVPQLRNMHEKTGFDLTSSNNNRGFGYIHDGSVDTLFEFLMFSGFNFTTNQQRRDVAAFLMCLATDTHAAVGVQTTVVDAGTAPFEQLDLVDDMLALADTNVVGVVVKGLQDGLQRGYAYMGSAQFQSDRAAEVLTAGDLFSGAAPGSELTYTVVPFGTQTRIGIDRDEDDAFDRDEIDAGSDPADPLSTPSILCPADLDGDGSVRVPDLIILLSAWGPNPGHPADLDADGQVRVPDLIILLAAWGACP